MSKYYIKAELQNMSQEEAAEIVNPDTLARIKSKDSNPQINVYAIGHEGDADGKAVGIGRQVLHYVREMIVQLARKVNVGIQAFHNHNADNSHAGRNPIGEVVGSALKTIGGTLHSLAAVYIKPEFRNLELDVASIEANIEYQIAPGDAKGKVVGIEQITGIALGSSRNEKPAFRGARLLGIVQAFTDKGGKMTKEEIIAAIKENNLSITDIFSAEDIVNSEPAKKAKQTEYEHAKRVEKKLGEERDKVIQLQKDLDDRDTKIKSLNEKVTVSNVTELFESAKGARKLNEKQVNYINDNLTKFKSGEEGDKLKDEFNRFLDDQLTEFSKIAKLLGVEPQNKDEKKEETPPGPGPADGVTDKNGKDLTKPENNDFIP